MAPRTRPSPERPDAAFIEAQITHSIDGHLRRIADLVADLADLVEDLDRHADGRAVVDEVRDRSLQVRRLAEIAAVVGRVA